MAVIYKGKYTLETDNTPKLTSGANYSVVGENLILSFFYDSPALPEEYEASVSDDGTTLFYDKSGEHQLVRTVHSRIILNKEEAVSLLQSIIEKIEGGNDD